MNLFTNKVQFEATFSEKFKLNDDAVPSANYIGFNSNVATQNLSNCFYFRGHYCIVCYYKSFNMHWVFMRL